MKTFLALFLVGVLGAGISIRINHIKKEADAVDLSVSKIIGVPSKVFASDGKTELGTITSASNTKPLAGEEISPLLRHAHLAAEDREFYTQGAISFTGLARAAFFNLKNASIVAGGSTITQQVVKNNYLSQEQTGERKAKEGLIAYRLENERSKDQILDMYLNSNYYGRGQYGIEGACWAWFGHSAKQLKDMNDPLQVAKAAFLASLLTKPGVFEKYQGKPSNLIYWEDIRKRMIYTLDGLRTIELPGADNAKAKVPQPVVDQAKQLVPNLRVTDTFSASGTSANTDPYLLAAVKDWLEGWQTQIAREEGASTEEEANDRGATAARSLLASGGLEIHTTIHPQIQRVLTEAVRPKPGANIGVVVLDPRTGTIDAMYGGSDYAKNPNNNALYASWQAGSTMKMVALTDAVANGISPQSQLPAPAFVNVNGSQVWNWDKKAAPGCKLNLADAIAQSNNPVAIQLVTGQMANCNTGALGPQESGYPVSPKSVAARARALGADDSIIPGKNSPVVIEEVPSVAALGSNTLSPLKLASMGATLANNGTHNKPSLIAKLVIGGKTIFQHEAESNEVISKDEAAIVNQVLTGVYTKGTASSAQAKGVPLAGKSGTAAETGASWMVSWSAVTGKQPAFVIASGSDGGVLSSGDMAALNQRFFNNAMGGKGPKFPTADLASGKRVGLK